MHWGQKCSILLSCHFISIFHLVLPQWKLYLYKQQNRILISSAIAHNKKTFNKEVIMSKYIYMHACIHTCIHAYMHTYKENGTCKTCPAKVTTVDFPLVPVTAKILISFGRNSAAKSNSDIIRCPCIFFFFFFLSKRVTKKIFRKTNIHDREFSIVGKDSIIKLKYLNHQSNCLFSYMICIVMHNFLNWWITASCRTTSMKDMKYLRGFKFHRLKAGGNTYIKACQYVIFKAIFYLPWCGRETVHFPFSCSNIGIWFFSFIFNVNHIN